jgi:hypothetical protein
LILPHYGNTPADPPDPFAGAAPGFFPYLLRERGLRETTLVQYRLYLQRLEKQIREEQFEIETGRKILRQNPAALRKEIRAAVKADPELLQEDFDGR